MFKIKCRCGKSEKNFKFEIGKFYIDECCEKAGFDALGNKKEEGMSKEELEALTQDLDDSGLEVNDNKDLDADDEPQTDSEPEAEDGTDEPTKTEEKPVVVPPPVKPKRSGNKNK